MDGRAAILNRASPLALALFAALSGLPGKNAVSATDVITPLRIDRTLAISPIYHVRGRIVKYRIVSERDDDGYVAHVELLFLRSKGTAPIPIFLAPSPRINGALWSCAKGPYNSGFAATSLICPTLPTTISLGRTVVDIDVWFEAEAVVRTGNVSLVSDGFKTVSR